ncbi:MAG: hypothetical protein ACYTHM_22360 [Planctomycetota bacterium]|jgi:hypothetical protein
MRYGLHFTTVLSLLCLAACKKDSDPPPPVDPILAQAEEELADILQKFPSFRVVPLQDSGTTTLAFIDSLIVDDIRGVQIDDDPPALQGPSHTTPASMVDGFAAGAAPYHANGILPFGFRYFTNANSYRGWHTWNMAEYASTHGFRQTDVYNSALTEWAHLPVGTQFYEWSGWGWDTWMTNNAYVPGRYDTLPDLDTLTNTMLGENFFYATGNHPTDYTNSMADMEHYVLSPGNLQAQTWYPSGGTQSERDQFEADYYNGYANTNICWMRVANQRGWTGYGIYGWQPFARQWFGLDTATGDPQTYWRWTRFGSRIYDEVEALYPSIYCFYWDSRNLAYMLANIDFNHRIISQKTDQKPILPFAWPLLHGGGGGWRWWRYQPIPDHEMQAMYAAIFFSPIRGFVLYGWSGTTDPHRVNLAVDDDRLVESSFTAPEVGAPTQTRVFQTYDVIHVTAIDAGDNVEFKFIDKSDPAGSLASPTTYILHRTSLEPALRPDSAGIDAMFEGMALARVFEFFLRFGQLELDVEATDQWTNRLPVLRRVKLGPYHVIVAYDPFFESHPSGRTVTFADFDGVTGRTLEIPTDGVVRIWILRD